MSMGWCPRCVCARVHPDTNLLLNKISQLRSSVDGILVTLSSGWSSKLLETWCGGRSNFCSMNKSSGNNGLQNKRKTKIKTLADFDIYRESTRRKTNLSLFSFTLLVAQLVYIPQTTSVCLHTLNVCLENFTSEEFVLQFSGNEHIL